MWIVLLLVTAGAGPITLTAADDGQVLGIGVGEELELMLPGNPSTGYEWTVVSIDPSILEPIGAAEFEVESDLVGAGGTLIFRCRGVAAGTTALELVYDRSFEDTEPLDTFSIEVEVD